MNSLPESSSSGQPIVIHDGQHGQFVVGNENRLFQVVLAPGQDIAAVVRALRAGEEEHSKSLRVVPLPTLVLGIEPGPDGWVLRRTWHLAGKGEQPVLTVPSPLGGEMQGWLDSFYSDATRVLDRPEDLCRLGGLAQAIGERLAEVLPAEDRALLEERGRLPGPCPFMIIESSDDAVLAMPWELLRINGGWPVRDGRLDMARCVPNPQGAVLSVPKRPARVRINVCAPLDEGVPELNYEAESYRISRALSGYEVGVNEMGELGDLVAVLAGSDPPEVVHFSGHGSEGMLYFENETGGVQEVSVHDLIVSLRVKGMERPPGLFYLACCYGSTPAEAVARGRGVSSTAARLHEEGIPQVIAHFGPVYDRQATDAEEAFYGALARGLRTPNALRSARHAMTAGNVLDFTPFAWALLVLFHRGADFPLGTARAQAAPGGRPRRLAVPAGRGGRTDVLREGFIGRRRQLHELRRRIRDGNPVTVVQGLGGFGKSVFCHKGLALFAEAGFRSVPIECALAERFSFSTGEEESATCGAWFVQQIVASEGFALPDDRDRLPAVERLRTVLSIFSGSPGLPSIVLYLDNLESLMTPPVGASSDDADALAGWRDGVMADAWDALVACARAYPDRVRLLASSRYQPGELRADERLRFPRLTDDEVYRMMAWWPYLGRLSPWSQKRLLPLLAGHGRAVQFLDGLVGVLMERHLTRAAALPRVDDASMTEEEWGRFVAPQISGMQEKLREDLLFEALWHRVLSPAERQLLIRLTQVLRPANWDLVAALFTDGITESAFKRLRGLCLVEESIDAAEYYRFITHPLVNMCVKWLAGVDWESERQTAAQALAQALDQRFEASGDIWDLHDAGQYHLAAGNWEAGAERAESIAERGYMGTARQFVAPLQALEQNGLLSAHLQVAVPVILGSILCAAGDLSGAEASLMRSITVGNRLLQEKPGEVQIERLLSVSYNQLGVVRMAQLDSTEAGREFARALDIRKKIAKLAPGDAQRQHDLVVSYEKMVHVLMVQGDVARAEQVLSEYSVLVEDLAAQDQGYVDVQRRIFVKNEKLGGVRLAQGNLRVAEQAFGDCLAIAERSAAQDQGNAHWQRDLSVSYSKLGEVRLAQGHLVGAEDDFSKSLEITQQLVVRDPGNAQWQHDLSIIYIKVGTTRLAQRNLCGADQAFSESLSIRRRLVAQEPGNTQWQRDLSISHKRMSEIRWQQGDGQGTLEHLMACLTIDERLAREDPGNVTVVVDYIVSLAILGQLLAQHKSDAREQGKDMIRQALALAEKLEQEGKFSDAKQESLAGDLRQMLAEIPDS